MIAFSVAFLIFIAGCAGGEVTTGAPTTPFLGGAGGLEISFLEENPPAEVTDGSTFPFKAIVSLKNVGESDINKNQIKVSLIGFLPSQFNPLTPNNFDETKLKDRNSLEDLKGRKRDADGNIVEPVETFLEFPEETNKNFDFKDKIVGNNIFIFRADACYKYRTKVKTDVCVLQNQIDKPADAICNPSEAKAVFSSASPIKVTSFRQNVAGKDKLQLSFDISHAGTGMVFGMSQVLSDIISLIDLAIIEASKSSPTVATVRTDITNAQTKINTITSPSQKVTEAKTKLTEAKTEADKDTTAFGVIVDKLKEAKKLLIEESVACPKDATTRRSVEDKITVNVDTELNAAVADDPSTNGIDESKPGYTLKCVGLSDVSRATTAKQSGTLKLINGKRTLTCTLDLPVSRSDFVKPMDINVDFNYEQTADTEVLVKRLLTE